MAEETKDNPKLTANSALQATQTATPAAQPDLSGEKSWGEKYKVRTYHILRNWIVNYFINFMIGASVTYAFDTSKLGEKFCALRENQAKKYEHIVRPGITKFVTNFVVRAQLLLCGGHALLPVLKWMKDNRTRLEFRIGHWLDLSQELLGRGNAASKRSIGEYHRVSSLVSIGDHNRKESNAIAIPDLSADDKALLAKHRIDEKLQFKERKHSWGKIIKARLTGVLFTTTTSVALGLLSSSPHEMLKFEKRYEEPAGKWVGDKIIARIPIVSRLFNKTRALPHVKGNTLTGHELIGKYFIDDMIFTAASKLGFDAMEKKHEKQAIEEEIRMEEAAAIAKAEAEKPSDNRRKIIAEGPKDLRMRAEKNAAGTSLSVH